MAYTSIQYLHDGGSSIEEQIQELSLFPIRVSGEGRVEVGGPATR